MRVCVLVLSLVVGVQATDTEDGPISKEKWKSDYTEKNWGLKFKTIKYTTNTIPREIHVLLEFAKDTNPNDIKAMNDAFQKKENAMEFCFFDQDGVIFTKVSFGHYTVRGELSGMKGDVVRCSMTCSKNGPLHFMNFPEVVKKVTKVELRPSMTK